MFESRVDELRVLQRTMLRHAREDVLRADFFSAVLSHVLAFCRCDRACLMLREGEILDRWEAAHAEPAPFRFTRAAWSTQRRRSRQTPDGLCMAVLRGERVSKSPRDPQGCFTCEGGVAIVPLLSDSTCIGVLLLEGQASVAFGEDRLASFESVAESLVVAVAHHRVQWALRERVKELTCLYGIWRAADRPGLALETLMQRIVELIPPGWQYPEITSAAIELDGRVVASTGTQECVAVMTADIVVQGIARGSVRVAYTEARPAIDEGPFLREEASLIREVARQVGLVVERTEAERQTALLEEQLRHADRLATIGRLAAGAAHELNEPLGGILGFAQLAKKHPGLSRAVDRDLDRIVKASLAAREVIRQLMLFARETPPRKQTAQLNEVVREALAIVRGRLARRSIRVVRRLAPSLPPLEADPVQLQQVVINLVVNALQAMPRGGTLTVCTERLERGALLVVQDTGEGMPEDVREQIFMPFYTTKRPGQGTGLGLSVVHGIVSSHGGTIRVESHVGSGTRFEVELPRPSGGEQRGREP